MQRVCLYVSPRSLDRIFQMLFSANQSKKREGCESPVPITLTNSWVHFPPKKVDLFTEAAGGKMQAAAEDYKKVLRFAPK